MAICFLPVCVAPCGCLWTLAGSPHPLTYIQKLIMFHFCSTNTLGVRQGASVLRSSALPWTSCLMSAPSDSHVWPKCSLTVLLCSLTTYYKLRIYPCNQLSTLQKTKTSQVAQRQEGVEPKFSDTRKGRQGSPASSPTDRRGPGHTPPMAGGDSLH